MLPKKHSFQSLLLLSLLWLIFYSSSAYAAHTATHENPKKKQTPYTNLTVSVPEGSYTTNNTHLLCLPASYNTVIFFFIGNYFSHAATVSSDAGASLMTSFANIMFALIIPGSGLIRGMLKIKRMAGFGISPLQRAARAGAVCIVVRNENWRAVEGQKILGGRFRSATGGGSGGTGEGGGDREEKGKAKAMEISNATLRINFDHHKAITSATEAGPYRDRKIKPPKKQKPSSSDEQEQTEEDEDGGIAAAAAHLLGYQYSYVEDQMAKYRRRVHGSFRLPPGYSLRVLRGDVKVYADPTKPPDEATNPDVSASYNLAKSLIAFAQLVLAFTTLIRSRGDQVDRYGYAAFGLTVTPYAIASLVSLASNCITPDYPSLFMVRNDVMVEAESIPDANGFFDGVVGFIKEDPEEEVIDAGYKVAEARVMDGKVVIRGDGEKEEVEYLTTEEGGEDVCTLDMGACGHYQTMQRWMDWKGWNRVFQFLIFFLLCLPLIIIGSLSGFHRRNSTLSQRVWLMCWLVFGEVAAVLGSWKNRNVITQDKWWVNALLFALFSVFPIGGFVVVAKMILDYGDCLHLARE